MIALLSSALQHSQKEALLSTALMASAVAGILFFSFSKKKSLPKDTVRPPHVWSLIPYLGSAIEMGAGVTQFIRKQSQKLQDTPVFTATILGDRCCFIADPEYLTIVFKAKYTKYLDSLSLQKQFSTNVLTTNELETKENFRADVNKVASQHYHHYLFKGDELQKSVEQVQHFFHEEVPQLVPKHNNKTAWVQHDLYDLVISTIFKATMGPIFSQYAVTDEMYHNFRTFDKGVIAMFNGAPDFVTKKSQEARSFIYKVVQAPEFWKESSKFMEERKQAHLEELKVSESTLHKSNLGLLWASVGNSSPAVFWTLLLLIEHEEAWKACNAQVDKVVAKRESKDATFTLDELDELTYLESALMEALRLYHGAFTARRVTDDFVLETSKQKYLIEKGTKLMSWWGVLHHSPDIFEDADTFKFDRFVGTSKKDFSFKGGKALPHDPVMPFGGGEHLCPGRKFASYETRLYLAMLMQTFDMRLAEGEQRPNIDPAMVGIGVCHPDRDPKVEIRPRTTSTTNN